MPGAFEDLPFDENTLCFKVMGKIFAICDIEDFESINLKCEPAKAIELREEWPDIVVPGYHMNKKHCPKGIPWGEHREHAASCTGGKGETMDQRFLQPGNGKTEPKREREAGKAKIIATEAQINTEADNK